MGDTCRCGRPFAEHVKEVQLREFKAQLDHLLRAQPPGDLSPASLALVLPPRMPARCPQNYVRGRWIGILAKRGYTVDGAPIR